MYKDVFPDKPNALNTIFGKDKVIIGMVHCKALPGSPHYEGKMKNVINFALEDAKKLVENGIDGLQLENAWDLPFQNPDDISYETVAGLTAVAVEIKHKFDIPVGINLLANGVIQAFAVAVSSGLYWVRCNQWTNAYVANEGIIEGPSAKALRYRTQLKAKNIKVFTDVHVKHGSHAITADRSIEEQALDNIFFDSDVLIATGQRTGDETKTEEVTTIKNVSKIPVIVGSGCSEKNIERILNVADGAIVGTHLKENDLWWNPVDAKRVKSLMDVVKRLRGE